MRAHARQFTVWGRHVRVRSLALLATSHPGEDLQHSLTTYADRQTGPYAQIKYLQIGPSFWSPSYSP